MQRDSVVFSKNDGQTVDSHDVSPMRAFGTEPHHTRLSYMAVGLVALLRLSDVKIPWLGWPGTFAALSVGLPRGSFCNTSY
jgi:hypothetical protein